MSDIIKMSAVAPSTKGRKKNTSVAFIAVEYGNSTVGFSSRAAKFLTLLKDTNIVWFNSAEHPFLWQFSLTRNTIQTTPITKTRKGNQWRFNDIDIVNKICEAFEIKGKGRVRLYIDVQNLVKKQTQYGELTAFQIFDIPSLREDFWKEDGTEDKESKERYATRYNSSITKVKPEAA